MEEIIEDNNELIDKNENNLEIQNDNYENMQNVDNIRNISHVNNIHSNIEIFEDVNNHIEEMIENNENFNNKEHDVY